MLYDDALHSLTFKETFVYGIDNKNNIVIINLESHTVKISNY